jgi:hypothetical protein
MERKQIQFTRRRVTAIHREARRRNTSDAAIVRQAIDAWLPGTTRSPAVDWISRARSVGRFTSGRGDVSQEHDRELSDAFER